VLLGQDMHGVACRLLATSSSAATTSGRTHLDAALTLRTAVLHTKVPAVA